MRLLLLLLLLFVVVVVVVVAELFWCDFMWFNIVMYQDSCELICFKLCMILDTTKLHSLIPIWMTLMFIQDHRVTGKLELV